MSEAEHEYTGVKIPREVKKKVRVLAADNETSIAQMAHDLLLLGLEAYEKGERLELPEGNAPEIATEDTP